MLRDNMNVTELDKVTKELIAVRKEEAELAKKWYPLRVRERELMQKHNALITDDLIS